MPLDNRIKDNEEILDQIINDIDDEDETEDTEEITSIVDEDETEEDEQDDYNEDDDTEEEDTDAVDEVEVEEDYKQKFANSTREAQVLASKNKKLVDTITEASTITDISEDELEQEATKEGLDFDELSAIDKKLLKKAMIHERQFTKIHETVAEGEKESKAVQQWATKVSEFLNSEELQIKFPQLVGSEEEFTQFSMKATRRGVDLEELVSAFSYDVSKKPKVKHKGSVLLTGSGARSTGDTKQAMNEDTVAKLRMRDPRAYARLIKAGKINIEV